MARKNFNRVLFFVASALLIVMLFACGPTSGSGTKDDGLKPKDIKQIANLTDYSKVVTNYAPAATNYTSSADEEEDREALNNSIEERKDANDKYENDIVRIYANSDGAGIIAAMKKAAVTPAHMRATVQYLVGSEKAPTDPENTNSIAYLVSNDKFVKQENWSFIDDWTYYDELKKRNDTVKSNATSDNLRRQERFIAYKVFKIGMTGAEFGRFATHELAYALTVTANMAGVSESETKASNAAYIAYGKANFSDYDTLVYLISFNEYYTKSDGLQNSVKLYGYYYDYNKNVYNVYGDGATGDALFEKQLKYSHMKTYSDAEWLEYTKLQRDAYEKGYRYSDTMLTDILRTHYTFQAIIERLDAVVYKSDNPEFDVKVTESYLGKTSTQQLIDALNDANKPLTGQLAMTDWNWCYTGNEAYMKDYNKDNNSNEGWKNNGSADDVAHGEFLMQMQQLKLTSYLLDKMTVGELNGALLNNIYQYSGSVISQLHSNDRDKVLIANNKLTSIEDVISLSAAFDKGEVEKKDDVTNVSAKRYAIGKIDVYSRQIEGPYTTFMSKGKNGPIQNVKSNPPEWKIMRTEIESARTYNYDSEKNWSDRKKKLENNVIKKKYDTHGDETGASTTEEYDETWKTSQFLSFYEPILKYVAGQVDLAFTVHDSKTVKHYGIIGDGKTVDTFAFNAGYLDPKSDTDRQAQLTVTTSVMTTLTVSAGTDDDKKTFYGLFAPENNQNKATPEWTQYKATPAKEGAGFSFGVNNDKNGGRSSITVTYKPAGVSGDYKAVYSYEFEGWFLDANLKYRFDPNDEIKCSLNLYAGYKLTVTVSVA